MERPQPNVSAYVGTALLCAGLFYFAARSPRPWTAIGLALTASAAYLATPDLIRHVLISAHHRAARRVGRFLAAPFKALRYLVLTTLALFLGVVLGLEVFVESAGVGAVAVVFVLTIFAALFEFVRWGLRDMARTVSTGGAFDRRLDERFGEGARLTLAGLSFLLGVVLQMIGTYIE